MRTILSTVQVLLCSCLLLSGCIEPYAPEAISSTKNYLVVDGFINSKGITTINLARTYDISANTTPPVETKASVAIEEEGGMRYVLLESVTKGTYTSASLTLNSAKNYRLFLRTAAGQEYASTYVPVKTTPAIDNIAWRATDARLNIYVNSHDDANKTQYYRWEYEETWEIMSRYVPQFEYKNGKMQDLTTPLPRTCWGNIRSTDIKISNTTRLNRDVVSDFLVRSFSTRANQLRYRYSILVRQHALTPEEYAYWELLKKNTENIGTLFDPLPAQLTGNVNCLNDAAELAIGYVGVHSLAEKRIFVNRSELPTGWQVQDGYEDCVPPDTVFLYKPAPPPPDPVQVLQAAFSNGSSLPIGAVYDHGFLIGYTAKSKDCVDCRTRGTATRPSFWQ